MSEQVPNENTPSTPPNAPRPEYELGQGLTGLSSAWPMYVGEPLLNNEPRPDTGPEAAAG